MSAAPRSGTSVYHHLRPDIISLLASRTDDPLAAAKGQATRYAYAEAILELGARNPDVVVLDADVSKSMNTHKFAERYPERSFNFGIAEQNMMAAAAGMASTGLIPYASTYAVFATMRALDQVRNSIHYPHLNVKLHRQLDSYRYRRFSHHQAGRMGGCGMGWPGISQLHA
jgi:transketolase C-terminal domain/subunit